jgi:nucleoid DNA-binding protein
MTKTQLIQAISAISHLTLAQTEAAIDGLTVVAQKELKTPGSEIALVGIGKLKAVKKPARVTMQFGVKKEVPAHNVIKFVVSSTMKDYINS